MSAQKSILFISSGLGTVKPPLSHTGTRQDGTATLICRGTDQTSPQERDNNKLNPHPSSAVPEPTDWVSHSVPVMHINMALSVSKGLCSAFISMQTPQMKAPGAHRLADSCLGTEFQGNTAQPVPVPQSQPLLCPQLSHQAAQTLLICATQTLPTHLSAHQRDTDKILSTSNHSVIIIYLC